MIQKLSNISYEMRLLTEIFFSQSRKREGLEDMELH